MIRSRLEFHSRVTRGRSGMNIAQRKLERGKSIIIQRYAGRRIVVRNVTVFFKY